METFIEETIASLEKINGAENWNMDAVRSEIRSQCNATGMFKFEIRLPDGSLSTFE